MTPLSPTRAAQLAQAVYAIRNRGISDALEQDQTLVRALSGEFSLVNQGAVATRFTGSTGGIWLGSESGLGFGAVGIGTRADELLIATRGTQTGQDWATDFSVGVRPGPSSWPVHGGFMTAFETLRPQLDAFLDQQGAVSVVHCVGHSLGGALATLVADYLSSENRSVQLYTFGSPRVGALGYSSALTKRLGRDRCFRVYHTADPVAMFPIFPFVHVPSAGWDCKIDSPGLLSVEAHYMRSYLASCSGRDWGAMRRPPLTPNWEQETMAWLDAADGHLVMQAAVGYTLIGQALLWLVKSVLKIAGGSLILVGATAIDLIAQVLYYGLVALVEVSKWILRVIERILRFLGRAVVGAGEVTVAFLRWLLDTLAQAPRALASRALRELSSPAQGS